MAVFKEYPDFNCCESCKALPTSARRLEPKDWNSKGGIRLKGQLQKELPLQGLPCTGDAPDLKGRMRALT
jgi:hypothetical protein